VVISNRDPFYVTTAWRRLRLWKLSEQPLCEHCLLRGIIEPATQVDHIVPISAGGEPLDEANLASLCASCHSRKTASENGGRVRTGCAVDGTPLDASHAWNDPAKIDGTRYQKG